MTTFNIQIISDTICPWCFIGLRRLQRAISLYKKTYPGGRSDVFNLTWHPYFLNTGIPPGSTISMKDRLGRMGEERAKSAQQHLERLGTAEGIQFDFGGRVGNTRDSHRLLHLAGLKSGEMQNEVAEALFSALFERSEDITPLETLVQVGESVGLHEGELRTWLESGEGGTEVDAEAERIREDGKGVPRYVVNGTEKIDGAEDASTWMELFIKLKEGETERDS